MENNLEEWRPAKGFEGLYEVSNTQKVRSLGRFVKCGYGKMKKNKEKILTPYICNGYYAYNLRKEGRTVKAYLHRLIAEAFIPNPENYPQIDHINTVRTDCRIENLKWCTSKQNQNNPCTREKMRRNAYENEGCKTKRTVTRDLKGLNKKVFCYGGDGSFIKEYSRSSEVAEEIGVPPSHVNNACLYGYALRGKLYRYERLERIDNHTFGKKKIYQYDKDGNFIREWDSISQAQDYYKVKTIARVCYGKRKTSAGYVWSFSKKEVKQ